MSRVTIKRLASEVSALLGEPAEASYTPLESPFPDIEIKVRILSPGILAEMIRDTSEKDGYIDVPSEMYSHLLNRLVENIKTL